MLNLMLVIFTNSTSITKNMNDIHNDFRGGVPDGWADEWETPNRNARGTAGLHRGRRTKQQTTTIVVSSYCNKVTQ